LLRPLQNPHKLLEILLVLPDRLAHALELALQLFGLFALREGLVGVVRVELEAVGLVLFARLGVSGGLEKSEYRL
jgi:hypothetical protein